MANNLNFASFGIEFNRNIIDKISDTRFSQEILQNALKNELFFDITLITEVDSKR